MARRTAVIATALPAALLARVPGVGNRTDTAKRLRDWAALAPRVALVVTAPFWLLTIFRGVLYPALGADNLEQSWGGPTLVGAWVTHLAVGVGALVVVSLLLAVGTRRSPGPSTEDARDRAG
jgi:hypothetical protein